MSSRLSGESLSLKTFRFLPSRTSLHNNVDTVVIFLILISFNLRNETNYVQKFETRIRIESARFTGKPYTIHRFICTYLAF